MENFESENSVRISNKSTKTKLKKIQRLFHNFNECLDVLIDLEVVKEEEKCFRCDNIAKLVIITENDIQRAIYRCTNYKCSAKRGLLQKNKLPLHNFCDLIFCILCRNSYFMIKARLGVSSSTIAAAKKKLRTIYKEFMRRRLIIGGPGKIVQADESVICRRGKIRNPTSEDDSRPDTVWILGIVDASDPTNFYVTRVENRSVECLTAALEGRIGVGSILHTDGHPSYPGVARNLGLIHRVVNHSIGFLSPDGTHTNNIENVWSQLKSEVNKEHGVKRNEIDDWLIEFTFRKSLCREDDMDEFYCWFIELLGRLIN
jgi:hypothetical protein